MHIRPIKGFKIHGDTRQPMPFMAHWACLHLNKQNHHVLSQLQDSWFLWPAIKAWTAKTSCRNMSVARVGMQPAGRSPSRVYFCLFRSYPLFKRERTFSDFASSSRFICGLVGRVLTMRALKVVWTMGCPRLIVHSWQSTFTWRWSIFPPSFQ